MGAHPHLSGLTTLLFNLPLFIRAPLKPARRREAAIRAWKVRGDAAAMTMGRLGAEEEKRPRVFKWQDRENCLLNTAMRSGLMKLNWAADLSDEVGVRRFK